LVDYFIKWVEAEAIASITTAEVRRFIWRNMSLASAFLAPLFSTMADGSTPLSSRLPLHLGVPGSVHCDHPQTNSQVEAANKSILHGLQKKLDDAKGKWTDELHGIL